METAGANEVALQAEIERFSLEATDDNPAGIVTDFIAGNYQIADDQAVATISPGRIISLLEALREIPDEDGPDRFWEVVQDFEEAYKWTQKP